MQHPSNNISIYTENITSGTLCLQQYKRVYHKNVSLHSFRIVIYRIVLETDFRGYQNKKYKIKTSLKARAHKTGINFMFF